MRTHVHSLRVADGSDALGTRAAGAPKKAARSRSSCAGAARPACPPGTRAHTLLHTVTGSSPRSCTRGGEQWGVGRGGGARGGRQGWGARGGRQAELPHPVASPEAARSPAPRAPPLGPPLRATARPGPRRWQGHPPGHRGGQARRRAALRYHGLVYRAAPGLVAPFSPARRAAPTLRLRTCLPSIILVWGQFTQAILAETDIPHVTEDTRADAGSRDEAEATLASAPEGFSCKVVLVPRNTVLAAISVEGGVSLQGTETMTRTLPLRTL